jgi:predicted nucleotidyltransferase
MFDPVRALRVLVGRGVRFVVIGGFAGRFWGSNSITNDLDICYARDKKNFEALASALRELEARLRGAPTDAPFLLDAKTLEAGDQFTFETNAGNLDCLGTPAGSQGYLDLIQGATPIDIEGIRVHVAALEDVIRLKSATGRPKDRAELEILAALLEEIERSRRKS